jgi:nicotinamidase/pyrazinamidase
VELKTKFSEQKAHWPGRKQVYRFSRAGSNGRDLFHHDLVTRWDESYPEAAPLLELVMEGGRRLQPSLPISQARARTLQGLERLPERYKSLLPGAQYPVEHSASLNRMLDDVRQQYVTGGESMESAPPRDEAGRRIVFMDVDTQFDFMEPRGALYVPGAEQIRPNLLRLANYARERRIPWIASADTHAPDDPSFSQWPPHCVVGTPGQQRIPETKRAGVEIIPNRPGAFEGPSDPRQEIVLEINIEKQDYSVAANPNFEAVLAAFGPSRFVVFGVATEYCVRDSALDLRRLNLPVDLVVDAVRAISEEGGRQAIKEMLAAGVRLVTTEEVCSPAFVPALAKP